MHASSKPLHQPKKTPAKVIMLIIGIVVLCGISFWGGTAYQKHHAKTTTFASANGGIAGGPGGGMRRMNGSVGQVTAVSSTSITVQDQRSGSNKTYTIDSSTQVTNNGQTAQDSDIQTGDTVVVMPASSGSTTASRILVNPSFGGGQGGPGNTQSN